jgi:RNA polymerase sigma-70 factor (ECF subfamily)
MAGVASMSFRSELQTLIPVLRRFARGLVRDREIADDLVQDTLLRALRAERRWNGGPMHVWLMTILTNLNRNRLRSLARRGVADPLDEASGVIGSAPTTGEARDITRALAALSDEHREVLVAVAIEGLSYLEAAQVLGIPEGTVMSRLSRARASLRSMLEHGDPHPRPAPHLRVVK